MPRILHLGVGNFCRAHLAWYTQHSPGWQITGVSFRSSTIRNRLAVQNHAYALVISDAAGSKVEQITCLTDMHVVAEDPLAVIDAVADPSVEVITLTVTEKAYHLGPDGALDLNSPAIRSELNGGPLTPVGALARGLAKRATPVTVLSCDNLPENGRKLRTAVTAFAKAARLSLPATVTFPSCMVDRITPATTDPVRAQTNDPMAVPTEAFTEWVIEDDFAATRPDWPGVQWVPDVTPHEKRKLRMLNGAHSYLAYAGMLAGHTFVHEAIADPVLRAGAAAIMSEAATTLPPAMQAQARAYAKALITRFENPTIRHRLQQIAMDGSQKLPIRIVATLADRTGQSPALTAVITAWLAFARREIAAGRPLDDPLAEQIAAACGSPDPDAALHQLIGLA
jgi:fructuronate reductase